MSPVKAYKVKQQFQKKGSQKFPIELTNTTGTYLHDINEDCLLQIFAVKSLSLLDLCSLAETCTRFQQITQRVLAKNLSIETWSIGVYHVHSTASREYLLCRPSQDIERIFRNFGSSLSEVYLEAHLFCSDEYAEASHFLLNLVAEYCVDNLEVLKIESLKIPADLTATLKPIFNRLRRIDLDCVNIEGDHTLFAGLDSLSESRLAYVKNCNAILENNFPKLERFNYERCYSTERQLAIIQSLTNFISRHTRLKILRLETGIVGEQEIERIVQVIGNCCKELEELSVDLGTTQWGVDLGRTKALSLQALQELKSLKTLELWWVSCDDFQYFAALTKLHELHLRFCRLPEDSSQLAFLTQIPKLHLCHTVDSDFDVVGIIRLLTNLEELELYTQWHGRFKLDEKTFSRIVAEVKGWSHVLQLKCNFDFDSENDEDQKVRLLPL